LKTQLGVADEIDTPHRNNAANKRVPIRHGGIERGQGVVHRHEQFAGDILDTVLTKILHLTELIRMKMDAFHFVLIQQNRIAGGVVRCVCTLAEKDVVIGCFHHHGSCVAHPPRCGRHRLLAANALCAPDFAICPENHMSLI